VYGGEENSGYQKPPVGWVYHRRPPPPPTHPPKRTRHDLTTCLLPTPSITPPPPRSGMVAVYGGEEDSGYQKPPIGSGLNKPCKVVLTGVYKKNQQQTDPAVIKAFSNKLRRYCSDMGAKFVGYEPTEGVWTFEVGEGLGFERSG